MAGKTKIKRATLIPLITECYGNISVIAQAIKVTRRALYNYLAKHEELMRMIEGERERVIDLVEHSLQKAAIDGKPWAGCFFLKTRAKRRGSTAHAELLPALDTLLLMLPENIRGVVQDALRKATIPQSNPGRIDQGAGEAGQQEPPALQP